MRRRRQDLLRGIAALIVMLAVWPWVSGHWIAWLKEVALPLAGGRVVHGPDSASSLIPIAIAVVAGVSLPWRRKALIGAGIVAGSFILEMLFVAYGALLGLPPWLSVVLGGVAQNVVPITGVLVALRDGGRA